MLRSLHAELQKAHRRHDLPVAAVIALLVVLWALSSAPDSGEALAIGYSGIYYSAPMMNAVVMPIGMAVLASRIWDVETQGASCKLLFTLMPRGDLFWGKAALGMLENAFTCLLEVGCLLLLGIVKGYTEAPLVSRFVWLFICTFCVNAMLYFFLLFFSMRMQNQIAPLAIGFCGALIGLFSAFMPQTFGYFIPFGYYVPLCSVSMVWDKAARISHYTMLDFAWPLLLFTILLALLCMALCRRSIEHKEV